MCMAESLHCSPKAITTLLIGHTPIQNKIFLNLKKKIDKRHGEGVEFPGRPVVRTLHFHCRGAHIQSLAKEDPTCLVVQP